MVIGVCLIAFHILCFTFVYLSPLADVVHIHHDGIMYSSLMGHFSVHTASLYYYI
jgi:hypothetical protein